MAIDDDKLYGLKGSQVKDLANKVKDKQDALVAGDGIAIASDGKTISATGTQTTFYANSSETSATRHIYKDETFTTAATAKDISDASERGQVLLRSFNISTPTQFNENILANVWQSPSSNDYQFIFIGDGSSYTYGADALTDDVFYYSKASYMFGNVVQTRGTSTSNVMSQDAASKLVYENPTSDNSAIRITTNPILSVPAYAGSVLISQGANAKAANNSVAIGLDVRVEKNSGIAIGSNSYSSGNTGKGEIAIGVRSIAHTESDQFGPNVALGAQATAHGNGNIALGYGAESKYGYDSLGNDLKGILSLEKQTAYNTTGFNDSQYMLIKGVYDPQEDHDAATKHYVDANTPTITMTTTDPGEGAPLSAGQFVAVYSAS